MYGVSNLFHRFYQTRTNIKWKAKQRKQILKRDAVKINTNQRKDCVVPSVLLVPKPNTRVELEMTPSVNSAFRDRPTPRSQRMITHATARTVQSVPPGESRYPDQSNIPPQSCSIQIKYKVMADLMFFRKGANPVFVTTFVIN